MLEIIVYTGQKCAPCAALKPEMVKLQQERQFPMRFIEASPLTMPIFAEMQIRSVPTVVCLRDGETVGSFIGSKTSAELRQQLTAWGFDETAK